MGQFHSPRLIVLYAIVLHFVWAFALLFDPAAGYTTAIHTLLHFIPNIAAVAVYASVAVLAIAGLYYEEGFAKPICLLPQQFVLMVSAGGAILAMYLGQFADGVERSHAFLIADQSPAVITAILHTYAICEISVEQSHGSR